MMMLHCNRELEFNSSFPSAFHSVQTPLSDSDSAVALQRWQFIRASTMELELEGLDYDDWVTVSPPSLLFPTLRVLRDR